MRIVIAGAGLAGLSLALALKQALADSHEIVVADPVLAGSPRPDERAYAISAAGRRMFEALGVWGGMADGAQPITDMVITDSRTRDVVRPIYLTFGGEAAGAGPAGEPFAHMVWSKVINAELGKACAASGVIMRPDLVREARAGAGRTLVHLASGESLGAALVVAADGARLVTGVIEGAVTRLAKGFVHKGKIALKSFEDSEIAPLSAFARKPEFVF
jgi:2-octaprenyl-6-methoxyphenol hydroxylase